MSGISNIIGAYNINPKRISSKLSFEVGQVFSAKIVATGELNTELILRLLDGWQFPAKLQKPIDFVPDGLVKFQVEGFSDGKLQIKLINSSKDQEDLDKNTIEDLLLHSKIDVDKEDYDILKNMIKHNMSLTKENISKVKTIIDFRDKILDDPGEEENFILKYLNSKNIKPDSTKGMEIKESLNGFFKMLKNISDDEILTMLENKIDLTEENIKSFIKVSKEPSTIYKELNNLSEQINLDFKPETEDLSNLLLKIKDAPNSKEEINKLFNDLKQKNEADNLNPKELRLYEGLKKLIQENTFDDKEFDNINNFKNFTKKEKVDSFQAINPKTIEIEEYENEDISNLKIEKNNEKLENYETKLDKNNEKQENNEIKLGKNNEKQENSNTKIDKSNTEINKSKDEDVDKNIENKNIENRTTTNKSHNDNLNLSKRELEALVKEQLSDKTEAMKNIIKEVIDKIDKSKPEMFDKVMQGLKDNINDFKVFNSISNHYYYLDIPINLNNDDYNCKLLIKDDRKTGKKIDSKNVSMVVSVKTGSIGIVDAYVKVKEQNMSVNIKCDETWIKLLSSGKNRITNELNELGYNTFFNIEKREVEVNLINCRDFFDDSSLNSINVKV